MEPMELLFVCTGNTCRSPMAEATMRRLVDEAALPVQVRSAGLRAESVIAPPASRALEKRGIQVGSRPCVQLTEEMVEQATLTLCATEEQCRAVIEAVPSAKDSVFVWGDFVARAAGLKNHGSVGDLLRLLAGGEPESGHDIADPVGHDQATYEQVADTIERLARETLTVLERAAPREQPSIGRNTGRPGP